MMTFALGVISERVETRLGCSAADHPAQRTGDAAGALDPDHEARTLLALVEGLSLLVLAQRFDPDTARSTFERHLAGIFGTADAASPAPGQARPFGWPQEMPH